MENKFLGLLDAVTSSYSGSFNTDKENAIIAANQRKLEDLAKYRKQREAEELKASLTLAGRMGLKPNEDPVLHTLVNTAAAGYSGLSRLAGQGIAAAVDTAREGFDANSIPQEVREARARQLNGTATLQDIDLLNAPVGYNSITQVPEKMTTYHRKQLERSGTNLDRIAQWEETQNLVADIKGAFDRSSVVDNRAREERERDVRENHKIDTIGDKAVSVLKQIVDHPRAALLDIGENAPQLAAGILGGGLGTAAAVGAYAVDEYQQALQDYRNKNNGAMPSKEWMQKRQALGAALAVPEYVGDRLTLGASKVVKEASKTAGKVVDGLEEGFKKSLLSASAKATNNMATRGAASTLLAGTGEYVTEDIQTIIEKKMKDEVASEMERHLAGSAGFAGGAGFHAGIPAVTAPFAVAGAIKEGREDAALARETTATETEAVKQAEESNDLTALLDKKSPAFSPDKALGVLHKKSLDESNTPEQRTEYQAQAKEIMDLFEKQYKAAELSSSAKYEENVAALEEAKKQLADTDPNSPDYAEAKMFADLLEDEVSKGAPDPDQEAKRKKDMEVLQGKMAQAEKIYEAFTNDTVNASLKDLDVGATVALADSQVDVADTEGQAKAQDAVKKVVLLSMASPDSLTADQAEALAKNTNNALGDNDRAYLNQFAQASRAMTQLKSMAQVSKEVMYGDDSIGQLGLEGYQYRMGKFLAAGDAKRADRLMEGLTNFLASHQSKYAALKDAEAKAQNGQRMQVVKRDGEWFAEPQTLPREELRKNKWYEVNPASIGSKFISNVGTELDAITSVHKALDMASGLVGARTSTVAADMATQSLVTDSVGKTTTATEAQQPKANNPQLDETSPDYIPPWESVDSRGQANPSYNPKLDPKSTEYVPPWNDLDVSESSGVTESLNNTLHHLSSTRQGKTFREVSQTEQTVLNSVLDKLKPVLQTALGKVRHVVIHEGGTGKGTFYSDIGAIGLSPDVFSTPVAGIDSSVEDRVMRTVTHETFHAEDHSYSNEKGQYWSETQPEYLPGGTLYTAVQEATASNPTAKKWFGYIFKTENPLPANKQARELYAQWNTLNTLKPEVLNELFSGTADQESVNLQGTAGVDQTTAGTQEAGHSFRQVQEADTGANGTEDLGRGGSRDGSILVEEAEPAAATLTPLKDKASQAAQWLKQAITRKPESKNQSLLTAVPALLDTLQNDGSLDRLNEFVDGGVTDADNETLGKVQKLYSALEPRIRGLLKRSDRKFKNNDAVLDDLFIDGTDGKPDLDQNVKIAMTLAGLAWIRDAVGNGPYNKDKAINEMLGRPKESKVSSDVRGELGAGYSRYSLAANRIGKQVVQSLGIKASANSPKNYLPLIENALGTYMLEALVDAGYAQVKEVRDGVLQSWFGKESKNPTQYHSFVTASLKQKPLSVHAKTEWTDDVKNLSDYFKGESKGLDRLFDVQSQLTWPSLTPPGFTQKKVSKSSKGIPKVLAQYLKKANNTPYTVEKNVWRFLTSLENESLQHELIGLDMRPPEHIHGDEAKAVEAKNAGKLRGLENLKEFIKGQLEPTELGLDQPVYFSRVMWNNQRVGEDAAINMQTDKTHRYAFTTKAWNTEIKLSDGEMLNKFKLRVLESFGVKTDQKNSEDVLNSTDGNVSDWDKWTKDPVIQAGMAVLQEQLKDEAFKPTLDQQKAVVAATKKGNENLHSFAGLMALAAYANAVDAGAESFNTTLTGEIDGVNNGPILTLLYLGVQGLSALAEKGGFFKKGSGYTNANRWKAVKGNLDIYQTATKNFLQQFGGNIADTSLYKNLFYFTGHLGTLESIEKAGRDLAKTPNTAFFFGSGIGSLRDGLIKDFEAKIIKQITKVAQIKDQAEQESARKTLIENINALVPVKAQLPLDTSIQTMMRQGFMKNRAVVGMAESFDYFIGEPFAKTLSESYQEVSHLRNQVTAHSTIMYSLYDHVYRGMKEGMIRDMVEKGEITKEHADKWDLPAEQEARLKEILKDLEPTVQSAMSQQDSNEENSLASALPVLKQRNINSDSPRYSRGVKLNRKADRTNTNNVRAASRTNSADEVRYVEPGVGMMAKMIHSSDSAKSHSVNPDYGSLNVHDARITGLKYYSNVGVEFNQATFNILMAYSPLREIYEARVRQLEALAKLKEDPQFKDIVEKAFNDSEKARWEAIKPAKKRGELFVPAANVADLFFYAQQADMNKLSEMAEWEYVDQYGSEGGQYEVTDKDRETVQRKINTLITYNYIPESVYQTIQKATGQRPTKYSNKEPQNRVASDLDMTVFFRENGSISGTEAVEFLNRLLTKRNQDNTFNAYLLDKIAALVPEKINVTLVRDRKDVSPELYAENSRGWTDGNGNVYLLDPSQDHSGLTPELLLHELVHSVLRQVIDSPKSKEQKEAVAALETLLKSTRESMDKAGTSGEFKAALSNLQEFVAWGSTNYNFQKQLAATKVRKSNLMEQFKDKLTRLAHTVFGLNRKDSTEVAKSAFGEFMVNFEKLVDSSNRQVIQPGLPNGDLLSMASPNQQQYFGTQAVFDSLSGRGNSADFTQKLQGLMDDVINKLHGPYGAIKAVVQQRVGETASDAWAYALATNQRLMGSRIQNSGLTFSEKEGFVAEQVEATVRAALEDKASANSLIYREVEKLYHQAKEALKGKIDPNVYKFVFSVQGSNGRSDYLSRFAALGLANESFNKALEFETKAPEFVLKGKTFMERLETVWRYAVDWASTKLTKGYFGQNGNVRLDSLIGQLVQSELRAQDQVNGKTSIFGLMDIMGIKTKGGVDFVKDAVLKAANSSTVKDSSMSIVKATGTLARIIAGDNVDKVIEGVNKLHNDMVKGRPGTAIALMNYIKGPKQWMDELVRSTKQVEKERLFVVNSRAKSVLSAFENKGENLTKEDKEAVSYVMLRTGMHYLFDSFGLNGIQELLEDRTKLSSAISTELANLSGFRERHFYIKQAKGLAVLLTTGIPDVENQLMNASNIARLYDTGKAVPAHADQASPIIERLVSLYALEYSERSHVSRVLDLMRSEGARNNGNGIEMVIKTAKYLDQQAREKTFAGNEALMIHGYTAEITDPSVEFDVARTPEEGEALVNKGYEVVGAINLDKFDTDQRPATLYVQRGGGQRRYQSGAVSTSGMRAKGTQRHNNFYNMNTPDGNANAWSKLQMGIDNRKAVLEQFKPDPAYNPKVRRKNRNVAIPVLNKHGTAVDYRYEMSHQNRDSILKRDNRFEHILGVMDGSTYDKVASREQNKKVMQTLRTHYQNNYGSSPNDFVHIHSSSDDAEMKEIWAMIPDNTKKDIEQIWGKTGIYVPKEMLDVLFGYRKASMADIFDKETKNYMERMFVSLVEGSIYHGALFKGKSQQDAQRLSRQSAIWVRRTEDVWQSLVHEAKDTIVVKTVKVLWDNVVSNTFMLMMKGVPIKNIFRDQHIALKGVMDYERDRNALTQLKAKLDTGYDTQDLEEIKSEIARLEDAINRNPIKETIDAGMVPTIADDVAMEDDQYSYKSQLVNWMGEKTKNWNKDLVRAGEVAYMKHDTAAYKFLSKATQHSDFVARYALFKHQTTRKHNPLSKKDAFFQASEAFVNYDLNLPKKMQYLDDMGLLPFIKYFLSIQRVLARNLKDDPLSVLNTIAFSQFLGGLPIPTDSSIVMRLGNNPIRSGFWAFPSTLPELGTVQATMALVD